MNQAIAMKLNSNPAFKNEMAGVINMFMGMEYISPTAQEADVNSISMSINNLALDNTRAPQQQSLGGVA